MHEAHDVADGEMSKRLTKEQARILDAATYTDEIREERWRSASARAKAGKQLAKERCDHKAVLSHVEDQHQAKERGLGKRLQMNA